MGEIMGKFTVYEAKAFLQEAQRRIDERAKNVTLNEPLNDIECSLQSNTLNVTSNVGSTVKKSDFISKDKYVKMLQTLEFWGVFKPKSLCFTYGVETCYRMFEYVLNTPNVSNKGAYFRAVLKKCA